MQGVDWETQSFSGNKTVYEFTFETSEIRVLTTVEPTNVSEKTSTAISAESVSENESISMSDTTTTARTATNIP